MKAIRIRKHGGPEVLEIFEMKKPVVYPDEVLVRVISTALNHLDLWVRNGIPGVPLPIILGSDGAGIIESIGDQVPDHLNLKKGDEVVIAPIRSCGECESCKKGMENLCPEFAIPGENMNGVQAEYVSVQAKYIIKKPSILSLKEAAAYPLATLTAYHMLVKKAKIRKDDWVLIYGASSGIGSIAIQIAKIYGANIITTVGTDEKGNLAKDLGARHIINYNKESISQFTQKVTKGIGVDIVFEHTGAKTWIDSIRSLKKGGKIVTCGATTGPIVKIDLRALFIKHQQLIGSTMGTMKDLHEISMLIEKGSIKPVIDKVFNLREIQQAHERLEGGQQFGKIVISFE